MGMLEIILGLGLLLYAVDCGISYWVQYRSSCHAKHLLAMQEINTSLVRYRNQLEERFAELEKKYKELQAKYTSEVKTAVN